MTHALATARAALSWAVLTASLLAFSLVDAPVARAAVTTYTASTSVNVRSGPGTDYEVIGQLDVDDSAEALARSNVENDWLLVQLDEADGWVAYFTVNVLGDPSTLPVLVPASTGDSLIPPSRLIRARFNVRLHDAPQLSAPTLVVVPFDSEVTAIGRSAAGDWLFVGFADDTGWGVAQLFEISRAEIQALPIYEGEASTP